MEFFKTIPELLKLPIKIIVALCFASGLILLLPNDFVNKLYMADFRTNYGFILGLIFVVSLSITICYVLFYLAPKLWNKLTHKSKMKKIREGQKKFLKSLNENELEIIRDLIREPDNTLELPMNRGIITKLEYYSVISKAGTQFAVDLTDPIIPYFLQPWVFEFFDEKGNLMKEKLIEQNKKEKV